MFEIIRRNDYVMYYLNNRRHKEDGPATIWGDGDVRYYLNGKLHRTNGPAIIWGNGHVMYFLNGFGLTKDQLNV